MLVSTFDSTLSIFQTQESIKLHINMYLSPTWVKKYILLKYIISVINFKRMLKCTLTRTKAFIVEETPIITNYSLMHFI